MVKIQEGLKERKVSQAVEIEKVSKGWQPLAWHWRVYKNQLDAARCSRYSEQKVCVKTRGVREPGVKEQVVADSSTWLDRDG